MINKDDVIITFRTARQQESRQMLGTYMGSGMSAVIARKMLVVFNQQTDLYCEVLRSMGEPSLQLEDIDLNMLDFEEAGGSCVVNQGDTEEEPPLLAEGDAIDVEFEDIL